jgi:hypothetical protein
VETPLESQLLPANLYFIGLFASCKTSGVPWLSCKVITALVNRRENSGSHSFDAEVSISYVEHVLKKRDISEELKGWHYCYLLLLSIFYICPSYNHVILRITQPYISTNVFAISNTMT